jgi:hypothetical protein
MKERPRGFVTMIVSGLMPHDEYMKLCSSDFVTVMAKGNAVAERDDLRQRIAELEEALKPFAKAAMTYDGAQFDDGSTVRPPLMVANLRAAAKLLEKTP